MSGLELKIISYVPAILGVIFVGLVVFLNNTNSSKNRIFALLNLSIALWLSFLFVADVSTSMTTAFWAFRCGLFFGQLMFLMFFLFAVEFPFRTNLGWVSIFIISLPIVMLSMALLTPLGVGSISIHDFGVQPEQIGPMYALSDFIGIFYVITGAAILLSKYRSSDLQQRRQILYVLSGLAIVVASNVFTGIILTLLRIDSKLIWIGSTSLFVFSVVVAYAIIKHRFFNVRPIVARSFTYLLLLISLSAIYGVIIFGFTSLFFRENPNNILANLVYLTAALLMAFSLQPFKKFFDRISNRLFYRDAYDPQAFLDAFNNAIVGLLSADDIVDKSITAISKDIKPNFISFYLSGTPHVAQRYIEKDTKFEQTNIIPRVRTLTGTLKQKVVITESLADEHESRRLYETLRRANVGAVIRLVNTQDHTVEELGYVLMGYKKSGNAYDSQDLRALEIIANELVIAIQNALRFQEIQNFNTTLQQKIEDATKRLRQTNTKLRMLDETKDDFISMASHQLRTPLTSVKGYVSMVLDGDAGKITPLQRKLLTQSFISSQRMVYLISDLLNVSRLRTGKFVIEPVPCNIATVIGDEVEQLVETARGRNLELIYKKPDNFPTYMLDETKTRQVIMNFIDNAIYYTPSGGKIEINLVERANSIEFTVVDNGIGVPKPEQHHLFTKFFRAGNAKRARPDGTGLGLFMAKKVVIAQGGAIIFKSQEGKGSTFGFTFAKDKLEEVPPAN